MKLNNYILTLNEKNKLKSYKEDICLWGIGEIIDSIYAEIKKQRDRDTIKLMDSLGIKYQTIYSWKTNYNPIAISKLNILLNSWKRECNKTQKDLDKILEEIYLKNKGYSQNGQRKIKLPREINNNIAYITGFFQGDGHLKKKKIGKFQEYSIYFYERRKGELVRINKIIEKEFGIKGRIYLGKNKKGHKWYILRISSKPIYLFFKKILGLKEGKKVRNIDAPKLINQCELSIQLSFVRGFFDAEGTIGENKKNPWLEIGQASDEKPCKILKWVRNKLDKVNINLSEPKRSLNHEFWKIRTSKRETIKRFFEIISSEHYQKRRKFEGIIKNG